MSQISYYRCAQCGAIVSIAYHSFSVKGEDGTRELEATDKCFSCGYVPFRVRDSVSDLQPQLAFADWME
ncbi:MAG TPA: hypothetical protein PLZ55_12010 [bacterium]|nr:hypothetical protein [bacterium]